MEIYKRRKWFITLQACVILLALLFLQNNEASNNLLFVLLYSLWNILSYAWLFVSEMKFAPDFHPFQVLTLASIQFIGLNGLSLFSSLSSGERIDFAGNYVDDILYLGFVFLSLEHLVLYSVFYYFEWRYYKSEDRRVITDCIRATNIDYFEWAKRLYLAIWILRLVNMRVSLSGLGSVFLSFVNIGYQLVLFLLLFSGIKEPENKSYLKYHWAVVVIEVVLVLGHGMKEEIIRPLIPYGVYLIMIYKSGLMSFDKGIIVRLGLIGAFVVLFVFPFNSIFRDLSNNTGRDWQEVTVRETFSAYIDYYLGGNTNRMEEKDRGAGYLMSRAGTIASNAWAIDYAINNGTHPEFFAYCTLAAIPRLLWKDKPQIVVGGMIDRLARGDPTWMVPERASEYGSSLSFGFAGACYFCFGFAGAVFFFVFHALFFSFLWYFIRGRIHYNLMALFVLVNFLFLVLKDFEAYQDCGISFFAINTVLLLFTRLTDPVFKKM